MKLRQGKYTCSASHVAVCRWPILLMLGLFVLCLRLPSAKAQPNTWRQDLNFGSYDFARGIFPTPDGGYIVAGHTGDGPDLHQIFLVKLDAFGKEQWRRTYGGPEHDIIDDFRQTSDGGYLLCGSSFTTGGNGFQFRLIKTDRLGNVLWNKTYGNTATEFARAAIETSDGGYAIVGRSDDGNDVGILLVKTDANGDELWSNTYGGLGEDEAWGIAETADNQLIITGQSTSFGAGDQDVYLAKIDLDGNFQWFQTFGGLDDDFAFDVQSVASGGYVVGGTTRSFGAGDYDVYLLKITENGALEWSQTYGGAFGEWGTYIAKMPDGGFALVGSAQSFNNWFDDIYLVRTDANGTLLWQESYVRDRKDIPHSIALLPDGSFAIAAHSRVDDVNGAVLNSVGQLFRIGSSGQLLSNYVQGQVFFDENNDCLPSANEKRFGGWHLTATKTGALSGTVYHGYTDNDGRFSILTDTGNYELQLISPNAYWQACQNNLPVAQASPFDTTMVDFPLQVGIACPEIEVDVATPQLRPCSSVVYELQFCNIGTAEATNAELAVTLDSALSFIASQQPLLSQTGRTWTFDIGNLGIGDCGHFTLETFLACDAVPGRAHLVTAVASPNGSCLPNDPQWDGSSLVLSAECDVDSVRFAIENTGTGGTTNPLLSIIVIDQIVSIAVPVDLAPGEIQEIAQPHNGKTLRLEVPQSLGHPGESRPAVSIEACGNNTGFVTIFPQDDADPFRSVHVMENEAAPTDNTLLASPEGIDNPHFIKQNTDIEYLIRFRNTGEDTAATVVILDTLSHWLDVTTVRQGASSHPYSLSVNNAGVLEFAIENAALPPASQNDTASVGYLKFRVSQVADAPFDSTILNRTSISFDYQQPVAWPQYLHTIQKPQIFSISDVSLCTGGLYGGVAFLSDTAFFELAALPFYDSLNYTQIDIGEFGATVVIDTFVNLGDPLNGWLLEHDTILVEKFDLGMGCDSIVVWNVEVLTNTYETNNVSLIYCSPNPFSDHLFFEIDPLVESIEIFNGVGQTIAISSDFHQNQLGKPKITLSTINWQPGVYLVLVRTSTSAFSPIRLVKN
ncbi:MAG: T9SS type A sorting domain-containing protein [Saprospiraceae bacterium]|nr:T9SS type A sorting domain-containing protein [Saprospiraceae bacterium]